MNAVDEGEILSSVNGLMRNFTRVSFSSPHNLIRIPILHSFHKVYQVKNQLNSISFLPFVTYHIYFFKGRILPVAVSEMRVDIRLTRTCNFNLGVNQFNFKQGNRNLGVL